jgi:hypothetical protein
MPDLRWIVDFVASLPKEFWYGVIGTVVGAVVSGIISYFIQSRALREARNHQREDHIRTQHALAHSLLFKVIQIHSNFQSLVRRIDDCQKRAAKNGVSDEPWQIIVPPAHIFESINFTADEMGMLLSLGDDHTFNRIAAIDMKHNSLVKALALLASERKALRERFEIDSAEDVARVKYDLSLRPRVIEANELTETIIKDGRSFSVQSLAAVTFLIDLLKWRLWLTYKIVPRETGPQE